MAVLAKQNLASVYFAPGKKNPIMIIDGYEFILHRRTHTSSSWACAEHVKNKCKVRLVTTGQVIQIKKVAHSHSKGSMALPEKSRKKYETVYKLFMEWRSMKNIDSFAEEVLLEYYEELSEKYKSSSLWSSYSMLRSTLNLNHGINIEYYSRLRAFLKRQSEGYRAKKAETFSPHEISKFINEAPDHVYLAVKVALIMGILGACRSNELHLMNFKDVQDLGSALLVTVPSTKTKAGRQFIITGQYYQICKQYIQLRPTNAASTAFFLHYLNGKCTVQNIGINKFGNMGKQIAKFLKLPNPELYTGHSFRKSSATLLVDTGGDMTTLLKKRI